MVFLICACARNLAPPPLQPGLALADVTVKLGVPVIDALKLEPPVLEAMEHDGKVRRWRIEHGQLKPSSELRSDSRERQPPFTSGASPSCRELHEAKGHAVPLDLREPIVGPVAIRTQGEFVGSRFQLTGAGNCSNQVPGQGCDPQNPHVFCRLERVEERVTLEVGSCLKVPLAPVPILRAAAAFEGQVVHVAIATIADGAVTLRYLQLEACR